MYKRQTSSDPAHFVVTNDWIVSVSMPPEQRFESATITISDRFGNALKRIEVEYRKIETPADDVEDSSVVATPMVASGRNFTVGLMSDGTVWTWGDNNAGQLGIGVSANAGAAEGSVTYSAIPVQVRAPLPAADPYVNGVIAGNTKGDYLTGIVKIAAGDDHVLALSADGHLYAWGGNDVGQLGVGSVGDKLRPTLVIRGKQGFAQARPDDLYTTTDAGIPAKTEAYQQYVDAYSAYMNLEPIDGVVDIAAGKKFSLLADKDGYAYTFGSNENGVLGVNRTYQIPGDTTNESFGYGAERLTNTLAPMRVLAGFQSGQEFYAVDIDETRYLTDIVSVAAGEGHAVALDRYGSVFAWGANGAGQLGNGHESSDSVSVDTTGLRFNHTQKIVPVRAAIDDVWQVSAGTSNTAAIRKDGTVWTWGSNSRGQLGIGLESGELSKSSTPLQIKATDTVEDGHLPLDLTQTDVLHVSVGKNHMMAVTREGKVPVSYTHLTLPTNSRV